MVKAWLDFVEPKRLRCATWEERDQSLVGFMGFRCYIQDRGPAEGSFLLNGVATVWPGRPCPRAWRALAAWQRGFVEILGGPIGRESLAVMELLLSERSETEAHVAADMVAVATDGYLRKQDLLQLRCDDVVFGTDEWGEEAVLRLGRSVRGESTKTGRDQTVRMDYPRSVAILRRRRQGQPAAARVFPIAGAVYDKWWRWAAK